MHGHMSRCMITCHDARSHVTMQVTCHDARSHERKKGDYFLYRTSLNDWFLELKRSVFAGRSDNTFVSMIHVNISLSIVQVSHLI
jgi:hypothetical protein